MGLRSASQPEADAASMGLGTHGARGAGRQASKPGADDIMQCARCLGIDLVKDSDLLWIAEQAFQ
eukprot:scaffold72222_cov30-Prasinocladus_malaysianus.AAC.1